jgi:signal transduction histidine kinase
MPFESSTDSRIEQNYGMQLFASTLAHEIRNPLQSMKLHIDLAAKGFVSETTFDQLKEEVNRLEKIIHKVQQFSRPVKLDLEVHPLHETIQAALKNVRYWLSASGISLQENSQNIQRLEMEIDSLLIEQVLLNLLNNAIQAMPSGGQLSLKTFLDDDFVRIELSDSGTGMEPKVLERVGSPFFTTKAKGSGLGVAFCKSVAALHGGRLDFTSEVGKGTIATLSLPIKRNGVKSCSV